LTTLKLPQLAWYGAAELELSLPADWQIEMCRMAGHARRALNPGQIRDAVLRPIGSPRIRDLAKNKNQVVIIFDDMSRATRAAGIVPVVLEELGKAGIADSNIRFVGASGNHIAMDRLDFARKLGEETLRRFPVYSHNPFGHCVLTGQTSFGTEIWANAEVMRCDLKIAVGSVVPHGAAGFGGGTKIVLPGICSFGTIVAFHQFEVQCYQNKSRIPPIRGSAQANSPRSCMDEAARLVGLDFIINTLMNSQGDTVAAYCGGPEEAFRNAVKDASEHYLTPFSGDNDIVIANTYAKANEFEGGVSLAFPSLKKEGGAIVLIGNAPDGHIPHYLFGPWGTQPHAHQTQINIGSNVNELIIFSEYPDLTVGGYFKQREKVKIISRWTDVLDLLSKLFPGKAKVAVYPNADIQYFRV
jgi:lactate racemase